MDTGTARATGMEEEMKEPWREEPPKLRIHITQTPGDYLNPEYVGETARSLWRKQ